jgi:PGM1 C-terminal domain
LTTGFQELQSRLAPIWALNKAGVGVDHVLVVLPSLSLADSLLAHYAPRIPALEHRYLVGYLALHRLEACEMVFLTCAAPGDEVLDYYTSLMPVDRQTHARSRLRVVVVPDRTARPVAAKLLDHPHVLDELRASFAGRPAFIEPWNVTANEVAVGQRLQAPINGTSPELWPLGYKSAGRRLFVEAGVPAPFGREDVHTVDDIVSAATAIRAARPAATGIVVKLDDSGAGDGNVVVDFRQFGGGPVEPAIRSVMEELPEWYLRDLPTGGVVEELIAGAAFSSPSAQVEITPFGKVVVLSTHEQVLGGQTGQVYTGCRFPADPYYAARLATYARAIGERLAVRGAIGRFSVDFAAACDERGQWRVYALEINLRNGGTTHPYAVLRNLVPGRYDTEQGQWVAADGTSRSYCATDNLVDSTWLGLPPAVVIESVARAGLQFNQRTGTGVVLHMLSCLAVDGRFGLTAIGHTPQHAKELYDATALAVAEAAEREAALSQAR